jgi:thiosulfate/3-mercaptopyruvate sulfurtransferase
MENPYPNMFPTEKQFIDFMKAKGVKLSTKVVLYDTKLGMPYYSTRAFEIFSIMGHPNVCILNGGLIKWEADGKPIE